jgi:hypothetical protein
VNVSTSFCVLSFIARLAAGELRWAEQAETGLLRLAESSAPPRVV